MQYGKKTNPKFSLIHKYFYLKIHLMINQEKLFRY